MFEINDYIMYGMTGVCQVIDITKENFINNIKREYYVLNHIYSNNTIIKIPVDNKKIIMRKILSKDDMTALMKNMQNNETVWIDDEKKRNEQFKLMLRTGETEALAKLVKSVYLEKENKKLIGKKVSRGDDEIMQTAERLLNEEFATILNITPEEVSSYILTNIQQ